MLPKNKMEPAIAIRFGDTSCKVSVNGSLSKGSLSNDCGVISIPSYVAFTQQDVLIGKIAKEKMSSKTRDVVFGMKTLLGLQETDQKVQEFIKNNPLLDIKFDAQGNIGYMTSSGFVSVEITTIQLLKGISKEVEIKFGHSIEKAVINTSGDFSSGQLRVLEGIIREAGIEILAVAKSSTAAVKATKQGKKGKLNKYLLLCELGAESFNTTVIDCDKEEPEEQLKIVDSSLGGKHLDELIFQYVVNQPNLRARPDQLLSFDKALRIRRACEKAKIQLSSEVNAEIYVPNFFQGDDLQLNLSRAKMEELFSKHLQKLLSNITTVLARIGTKEELDVLITGGCSKIPKIQSLIKELLPKANIFIEELGLLIGAHLEAEKILRPIDFGCMITLEVLGLSIGLELEGGLMKKVLQRNQVIPVKKKYTFSTASSQEGIVKLRLFCGERPLASDNQLIREIEIPLSASETNRSRVAVIFDIDPNIIFNISIMDHTDKLIKKLAFSADKYIFPAYRTTFEEMIADAEKNKEKDLAIEAALTSQMKLKDFCYNLLSILENKKYVDILSGEERVLIDQYFNQTIKWLRSAKLLSLSEINEKGQSLTEALTDTLSKIKSEDLVDSSDGYLELL